MGRTTCCGSHSLEVTKPEFKTKKLKSLIQVNITVAGEVKKVEEASSSRNPAWSSSVF
jgi:hypothetical protein